MQDDIKSLSHSKWRCKYHIVFALKYRRQEIYGKIKADMGQRMTACLMLHLAMIGITKKWTGRRQDWGAVHSQPEIFFADRIPG